MAYPLYSFVLEHLNNFRTFKQNINAKTQFMEEFDDEFGDLSHSKYSILKR